MYCWICHSSKYEKNRNHYAAYTAVLWHWLDEMQDVQGWRGVGQVAPDDLAAVPTGGRITAVLEVTDDGRVWTRVKNDQNEPMAILVGSKHDKHTRPGVTSLEVSNISCPEDLNAEYAAQVENPTLDWFGERVISDRLVINRTRLRTALRARHEDVWGGEDIASACQKQLNRDPNYLEMIPGDMPELRAFVENCLSSYDARSADQDATKTGAAR